MEAKEFLEEKEKGLIKAVGHDSWFDNKVYLVSEVLDFLNEYRRIMKEQGLKEPTTPFHGFQHQENKK